MHKSPFSCISTFRIHESLSEHKLNLIVTISDKNLLGLSCECVENALFQEKYFAKSVIKKYLVFQEMQLLILIGIISQFTN